MKVIFSEWEKEQKKLQRRMDEFDRLVCEYLRANRKTTEYLAEKVGCDKSSLWRYRRREQYFKTAPFDVICRCLRMANASNEQIRIICGLPTGQSNEKNEI